MRNGARHAVTTSTPRAVARPLHPMGVIMSTSRARSRVLRPVLVAAALTVALLGTVAGETAAGTKGSVTVAIRDECEPTSFNAALGPGACVGDGDVTIDELFATLNPADFGHDKWRFQPSSVGVKSGTTFVLVNRGGETHSFTEVQNFGPGVVPPLNAVFPEGTPPAVPVPGDPHFVDAGGTASFTVMGKGTHLFMCLIHPWMETTVTVK